jgi:hypothetical protein
MYSRLASRFAGTVEHGLFNGVAVFGCKLGGALATRSDAAPRATPRVEARRGQRLRHLFLRGFGRRRPQLLPL